MSTPLRPRLDAPDLELLRAFEPVVRYTAGESFLPMQVATYLANAARLRSGRGGSDVAVGAPGTLSLDSLADIDLEEGAGRDYLTVAGSGDDERIGSLFRADAHQAIGFRQLGGRLSRVGYGARVIDALFSLSLLARGRVPGSLARRAVQRYRAAAKSDPTHPYYGRVVRTATWTVLQYWFFYAFNDWRSGFNGANDHEADWEQVLVYLDTDGDGRAVPRWAAFAQHDYQGGNLRRRWDDRAELDLVDDHPVVYAGAGSHASYFRPGDYIAEQELRMPIAVKRAINAFTKLMSGATGTEDARVLAIAFIDYARGDGVSIGPAGDVEWQPVVLDETQAWVSDYRGLWGLSVRDPFEGEDAPAGPMFNRDGSVRLSWAHPVGFAALDIEPPPSQEAGLMKAQVEVASQEASVLARQIADLERGLAATPSDGSGAEEMRADLAARRMDHEELRLRVAEMTRRLATIRAGETGPPPQAHLKRIAEPQRPGAERAGMLLEAWAAVSIGLLLLALIAALLLAPRFGILTAGAVIAFFVFVESVLRNRVVDLLTVIVRLMAFVAGIVLAIQFWYAGLIAVAIAAALFVIRENVVELLGSARTRSEGVDTQA